MKPNKKGKRGLIYTMILFVSIVSCMIRYPDFETTLWSASDTNYQCLMNAKAMLEADEGTIPLLPMITFSEDTDYGLEYSSGAFDKETGKYFYYVSFPSFPFVVLMLFFKVTGLAVNEISLYIFCSILFCVSVLLVVRLFIIIFSDRLNEVCIAFVTGITYLFSFEIMHSMGLTYWGQNWYMIIFPLIFTKFFDIVHSERPLLRDCIAFGVYGFLLLQTEWSGYFALFAFGLISLIKLIRYHENKYLSLVICIVTETVISAVLFVLIRADVVGFHEFVRVIAQRTAGRSRIADYSILAVEQSLIDSFGNMIILTGAYLIWALIYHMGSRTKVSINLEYISMIVLLVVPLSENHVFTNHALTYSMDRMKWYFLFNFILLLAISKLISLRNARIIIYYSTAVVMLVSVFSYIFVENNYRWSDRRLKASRELSQYINKSYSDCALGQLGSNSVWGYSKMLFGHGIEKETSVYKLIERAEQLNKRYAVALNDLDLSYTQKWYSSAVIYDSVEDKFIVAGSLCNQFCNKINDLEYLTEAAYVDIYVDRFDNFIQRISFPGDSTIKEKEEMVHQMIQKYELQKTIVYFTSEVKNVPNLIMVDDQNSGEWVSGVSVSENRLIFLNTNGYAEMLDDAKSLSVNGESADIVGMFTVGDFIYADMDTDRISDYSYPNTISISYEGD